MRAESEYWEKRYRAGGDSGAGSVGEIREWKWRIIERYAGKVDDVIDVGCGDLSFWKNRDCPRYLGLDTSHTIVERDRHERPKWEFRVHRAEVALESAPARIVLCLDVLFHIMNDQQFDQILENLCRFSKEWIFIYTWIRNPFDLQWALGRLKNRTIPNLKWMLTGSDGEYEKFRSLENYLRIFAGAGFELVHKEIRGIGAMYAFTRDSTS